MTTRTYKSTDSGAPVLTGQIDSFNGLLKAILINGIGGAPASPWSLAFEDVASHTCVFRPPSGNRHFLQVVDSGTGTGGTKEATMRGYGNMTAYNTGTDPFPTTTQQASGLFARKSATADSTARPWRAFVDEKTLHLFVDAGDVAGTWDWYTFGQFNDWSPSGAWGSVIAARFAANSAAHSGSTNPLSLVVSTGTSASKIYGPRDYTQTGTAVEYTVLYDSAAVNTTTAAAPGTFGQSYPYPVDNGIIIMPARLALGGLCVGRMRGLWLPGHNKPLVQDDTFNATEGTLTRSFAAQNYLGASQFFIETTATWDSE